MSEATRVDRRKSPRYDARLTLNVHLDLEGERDRLKDLETINVSSSGLYFFSAAWIEPIVVRTVPEVPDPQAEGYEVAVFFTTIDADSLMHLESYLDQVLSA